MRTGSPGLWALADAAGVVPAPPDPELAALLGNWWAVPRVFGCQGARGSAVWTVIAPDPSVLCPDCALLAYEDCRTCAYCKGKIRKVAKADLLAFEMNHGVRVFGRAHADCARKAAKRS